MYNGIEISEFHLLFETIWISVLVLVLLITISVSVYYSFKLINRKNINNLKKLKERADNDEIAKKRLEKLERKLKRKKEKTKTGRVGNIFFWILIFAVVTFATGYQIVPGWVDYAKKDYVIYSGDFTVEITLRRTYITLEDGTVLYGNAGFDDDDTHGTIVYTRRTHTVLGGER